MYTRKNDYLQHDGKKGMKWGYNDGKRNGKRTAGDDVNTVLYPTKDLDYYKDAAAAGAAELKDKAKDLADKADKAADNLKYDAQDKYYKLTGDTKKRTQARVNKALNSIGSGKLDDIVQNPSGAMKKAVDNGKKAAEKALKDLKKKAEKIGWNKPNYQR